MCSRPGTFRVGVRILAGRWWFRESCKGRSSFSQDTTGDRRLLIMKALNPIRPIMWAVSSESTLNSFDLVCFEYPLVELVLVYTILFTYLVCTGSTTLSMTRGRQPDRNSFSVVLLAGSWSWHRRSSFSCDNDRGSAGSYIEFTPTASCVLYTTLRRRV